MMNRARDYECIENITDAWKTLGIDEVKHTENVSSTPEDELQEFAWQRSKSFNRNETRKISIVDINENSTSVNGSNGGEDDGDYDRLEFFPPSNQKITSSGYKTIVPINALPTKKKPQVSDDYEIIIPNNESISTTTSTMSSASSLEPQLAASRLADDSYLGYGVIRKSSLQPSSSSSITSACVSFSSTSTTQTVVLSDEDDLLDHGNIKYNQYAIVSKPKRV